MERGTSEGGGGLGKSERRRNAAIRWERRKRIKSEKGKPSTPVRVAHAAVEKGRGDSEKSRRSRHRDISGRARRRIAG